MKNKKSRFAGTAEISKKLSAAPEAAPRMKTGRPPGKKSDPAFKQVTVYLRKETHETARRLLFDEHREFSELVDQLVREWLYHQKSRNPQV